MYNYTIDTAIAMERIFNPFINTNLGEKCVIFFDFMNLINFVNFVNLINLINCMNWYQIGSEWDVTDQ
jgi:hypothetical protein